MTRRGIIALFFVLACVMGGSTYAYSVWSSYHAFDGRCLDCHLSVPADGSGPGTLKRDITYMCTTCHKDAAQLSHPVDVTPTMQLPPDFPLDWKGQVTCATCHPIHQPGFGRYRLRAGAAGEGFCMLCHFDNDQQAHRASVGAAHSATPVSSAAPLSQSANALDALSIRCLACHDAVFGGDTMITNRTGMLGFHGGSSIGISHPIGMNYYEAKRLYKGALQDPAKLPKEVRLFGGIVGCGTCHNPYSGQHQELVISNEASALCMACHRK